MSAQHVPPAVIARISELRLPFKLLQGLGGWYLAIGCTRSPKYGRISIQQAGITTGSGS